MTKTIFDYRNSFSHKLRRGVLIFLAHLMRREWETYPLISTSTSITRHGVKYTFKAERVTNDQQQ